MEEQADSCLSRVASIDRLVSTTQHCERHYWAWPHTAATVVHTHDTHDGRFRKSCRCIDAGEPVLVLPAASGPTTRALGGTLKVLELGCLKTMDCHNIITSAGSVELKHG